MKKILRSRNIRIRKTEDTPGTCILSGTKLYFASDGCPFAGTEAEALVSDSTLAFFEYSEDPDGQLDTVNFHVDLCRTDERLYRGLTGEQLAFLKEIPLLFDESFRNYTVGYRMDAGRVVGRSFYYYPTVWRGTRYGMHGITDPETIARQLERFLLRLGVADTPAAAEVRRFGRAMIKFRGVSVSYWDGVAPEYKLYGRMDAGAVVQFLNGQADILRVAAAFGPVAMVAQRIRTQKVTGYNLYYLP